MNTTFLSYQDNDEITSIMNKKFISQFKSENDPFYFPSGPKFNLVKPNEEENSLSNKIDRMNYLFPSIPKEKIEPIFNTNKDLSFEKGVEQVKNILSNENKINQNKINFSFSNFRRTKKRNYIELMSQTQQKPQINIINNTTNINNINSFKKINNNNINSIKNEEDSRINLAQNNNAGNEREKERKKLELKIVDKVAEELVNSKDKEDLKKYLFIQLVLLEAKRENDKKIIKINNIFQELDKDKANFDRCMNAMVRCVNKNKGELNRTNNEINELNDKINKTEESIKRYEYMGNLLLNIQKMKLLNI